MSLFATRSAFAAKLLANAGLDLETLFKSGDAMALKSKIAASAGAPEAVKALFANAELNLDAMLATGPDALKAHLASLAQSDEELATANKEIERITAELTTKGNDLTTAKASLESAHKIVAAIGLDPKAALTEAAAKTAFETHVKKAANAELAKSGHPPVKEDSAADSQGAKTIGRAAFTKLSPRAQLDFVKGGGSVVE